MAGPTHRRLFAAQFWLIGFIVVAITLSIFAYLRWHDRQQLTEAQQEVRNARLALLSLDKVVQHKLNANYQDADADLVADPPTNPAKYIDPATLTFCYVSGDDNEKYQALWKDFCNHLSKTTGKPVEYLMLKSSNDEIQALQKGTLHVAGINTGAVPMAVNEAGFVPAFILGALDKGTCCEIIVPNDSLITKPEDLQNKTIEFVELNSNTGYKVPVAILNQTYKMLPETNYDFNLSYSHEMSIKGIAQKKMDAAAVASDMLDRAIAQKMISPADFRVIFKSDRFPPAALGFAYNLKPALQAKVREAFQTYAWPAGPLKSEFAPVGQDRFTPTNYKQDWATVRTIDNSSGVPYNIK